jgi:hypothetical protein
MNENYEMQQQAKILTRVKKSQILQNVAPLQLD